MDRLKNYIIIFAILVSQKNIAQNKVANNSFTTSSENIIETIIVNTNTNTLIVGETLFYKIYCAIPQNKKIGLSKIAYIALVDKNKNTVFKHKLFLNDGKASSSYFLPSSLETGNYKLIGYTHLILNQIQKKINIVDINIINPYKNINSTLSDKSISNTTNTIIKEYAGNDIKIILPKTEFNTRELVNIEVNANSKIINNGEFCISVQKIDALSTAFSDINVQEIIATDYNPIPEIRGELIHGKIVSKQINNSLNDKVISLTIQGENKEFKITKSNNLGKFIFNLEKSNNNKNVLLQVVDPERSNYSLELSKPVVLDYSKLSFTDLNLKTSYVKSLEERAIASQIENAFFTQKKDSTKITKNDIKLFDPKLITIFNIKDYTRFTSIKETILEIMSSRLELIKNREIYTLKVNDFDAKNEFPYPTLVLFDGILIQNTNDILDYNTNNLESISVLSGAYEYGTQKYNGVVHFKSKNNDYKLKEKNDAIIYPDLLRPQSNTNFYQPNYATNDISKRIPDYRYQLLWKPSFKLNNAKNIFSFYTSDVTGLYEIIIQGVDGNGKPIKSKNTITVK